MKECKYCSENEEIKEGIIIKDIKRYDDALIVAVEKSHLLVLSEKFYDKALIKKKINYCPMCGRNLKED